MAPLGTPAQAQSSQWAGEPMPPYHDREDDGGHRGLEDPEHRQAEDLYQSEEVDPAQGHVPQEGVVWLVLGRHEEELAAFPELAESARLSQQWGPWWEVALLGVGTREGGRWWGLIGGSPLSGLRMPRMGAAGLGGHFGSPSGRRSGPCLRVRPCSWPHSHT